MEFLENKRIILGVSGGIACYKSVELMRHLQRAGADVRVAMTRNAGWFVGPVTFEAISGHPVFMDMFESNREEPMRHISWAENADAAVIAPATGNIIGKLANGIADDALSTLMLAVTAPKLICPAMNTHMYENRSVQRNLEQLEADGYIIVEPSAGELACKAVGPGRLADPERIYSRILDVFLPNDYFGKKVVVTAGPTREPMDPVRFISNPSSGKMGYALARAAAGRGAHVILVSGPTEIEVPDRVHHVWVETAQEMAEAVFAEADSADMIIKVAAVSDYRPVEVALHKVKKGQERITLELEKTTDILAALAERKCAGQILVGFAAETRDLEENATAKLAAKKLDMIAANLIGGADSGFRTDTNHIRLFYKNGKSEQLPLMDKEAAAHVLLDRIITLETA
ncbi:MAG: bifunctional phosphopantothenoylcysteine decarboxylase/phosphopantothenate--cysteine ligase CoaBC [Desulfobacteraceae bacterium]|nr:bifunctional phosphopantothenoylcysteine decarboxylase/phosphopantothenate--cysteine ligase CoaBC [Desulfobacteraceae bacterium]